MSKITSDGLTRSGRTRCFIAVAIMATVGRRQRVNIRPSSYTSKYKVVYRMQQNTMASCHQQTISTWSNPLSVTRRYALADSAVLDWVYKIALHDIDGADDTTTSVLVRTYPPLRLRSHWYEYEYESRVRVSVYGSYKLHPYEWAFMVTCTRTTQRVSTDNLQKNRIELMLCEKVTIFY